MRQVEVPRMALQAPVGTGHQQVRRRWLSAGPGRKAAMVSNPLVVLYSEQATQQVLNVGSLYQ